MGLGLGLLGAAAFGPTALIAGAARNGIGSGQGMRASNGEQILRSEANRDINALQHQGTQAAQNINQLTSPQAVATAQAGAVQTAGRANAAVDGLQDSAQQQYGVELSPAQQKAQNRMRGLRGAASRAAAANGTADRMFEERLAAINDLANVGTDIRQQGLAGLRQSEAVASGVAAQNQANQDSHMSGIGGLIGTGVGFMAGGAMGAAAGGAAGGAIF